MTGYATLFAECGMCDRTFTANPERVPCFPIDHAKRPGLTRLSQHGRKTPVCAGCLDIINALRAEHNLAPQVAMPGAYTSALEC